MNTIALPRQTNVSESIRVSIKRLASHNGGLAQFLRDLGMPYNKTWERVNRNKGDLIDGVIELAQVGFDDPFRIAAEAAGYEVMPKTVFLRKAHPGKAVRSYALDIHHATSALTMLVEDALSDGGLSSMEKDAIKAAAQRARVEIAELVAKIEGEGR